MKLKYLWLIGLISLFLTPSIGQKLFKTQWTDSGVKYLGLVIYYDENDVVMRVNFDFNGRNNVAEYKCKYSQIPGSPGYLLDGFSAKMVRGDRNLNYVADNFFWVKKGDTYGKPHVLGDHALEQGRYEEFITVDSWQEIQRTSLTTSLVKKFFRESDDLYKGLLSLNSNQELNRYRISTKGYGNGKWAVAMSKGTDLTTQSWKTYSTFPSEWVKTKWDKGFEISSVSYGNGLWGVTMSKGTGYSTQEWRTHTYVEFDWLKKKWSEGYAITSLAYGNGKWATVVSKGTPYTYQEVKTSVNYPQDWVNQLWDKGFSITSVAYGNGLWGLVMSEGAGYGLQKWKTSYEYPKEWIAENWDNEYYITSISYGQGLWCVVMSEKSDYTTQSWKTSTDFPQAWVQKKWDEHKKQNNTTNNTHQNNNNNNTHQNNNNNQQHFTNSKMHLIVVANTKIADIGASCEIDQRRVENEFEVICNELNIGFNKVVVNELDLKKENVTQALNNLNPSPNDIVVFVYTGHGYRFSNQTSRYPRISLRTSNYQPVNSSTSYGLEEIYREIVSKGARLNLVFGDCCNSDIGITMRSGGTGLMASRSQLQGKISRLKKLFIDARGNLLVAAAQPNETACGNSRDGGYFIFSFFQSLNKETSYLSTSQLPRWDNIIQNTINAASYKTQSLNGCKKQNGIYKSTVR